MSNYSAWNLNSPYNVDVNVKLSFPIFCTRAFLQLSIIDHFQAETVDIGKYPTTA